jgi:integrase
VSAWRRRFAARVSGQASGLTLAARRPPTAASRAVLGVRRIQDIRRTCGSLLATLDVHPRVAMTILRHSRIGITMEIYTQVPDEVTMAALRRPSDRLGTQ